MTYKVLHIYPLIIIISLCSSCIKDDNDCECPTAHTVSVAIKDKNYFNAGNFPEIAQKDEKLPFQNFSTNIYYLLRNTDTGETAKESALTPVTDGKNLYSFTLNNLPQGTYELSVWGNLTTDVPAGTLHPAQKEHMDIYVADAILKIGNRSQSDTLYLERTKGKLLVICTNFSTTFNRLQAHIKHLYQSSDSHLVYGGDTEVNADNALTSINEFLLAPTPTGSATKVNLTFYSTEARSAAAPLIIPETEVTLNRNELTAIRVDYNDYNNTWDISVYADGKWTLIHHLVLS